MDEEIKAIKKNDTYELATSWRSKIFWSQGIFKERKNAYNKFKCYIARLVATGYSQQHVVDYKEVFALMAHSK